MPLFVSNPTKDTYLQQDTPTDVKGAGSSIFIGESNATAGTGQTHRTLIYFDLSAIPVGSTIISAKIALRHHANTYATNGRTFHVYRVIRYWEEGSAHWNRPVTGLTWGTNGCGNTTSDFIDTSLGSRAFSSSEAAGWKDFSLNTSIISQIINGELVYEGFVFRNLVGGTAQDDMQSFRSKDYVTDPTHHPYIEIDYNPPRTGQVFIW